jgi:competence protein ComEA
MTLPGIGEAKAQKIIDYRSSTRFRKTEDIKSVNGIGDAVYNNIKDKITV